jgi:hypothetical protein
MAQPVWTLSVDLQTKTATFQTGMAEAAQSARGAFSDIKQSANEMADGVEQASGRTNYSMTEARHGVMMLGEEFGIHLPRGLTTFIASLGPVGAAMEAAFPFLAIILGATLLIEHLAKIGEAAEKAAEAGHKLDDDMTLGLNHAKEALIDAQIEARNLAGLPAWDLLAEKLKMKDADKGVENLHRLDGALKLLLEAHGSTSNWNPFNWLDHSDDLIAKAKALQESLHGKGDTQQIEILGGALAIQTKILNEMQSQSGVSAAQLHNQQAYVDLLREQTAELQAQADAAVTADQNKQTKDRTKAMADHAKELSDWETYLNNMDKAFEAYVSKARALKAKQAEDAEREAEMERKATESVLQAALESQKKEVEGLAKMHDAADKAIADDARMAESKRKIAEIGVSSGTSSYLLSKLQEQERLEAILRQEQADLMSAHQKEVAEQQSFIGKMNELAMTSSGDGRAKALEEAAVAQDKLTRATMEFNQAMAQNKAAIAASDLETLKLHSSWHLYFAQSNQEMRTLTATLNTQLQSAITQVTTSFSQGMAKSIVEGKNFGASMRKEGEQIAEEMIQHLIQWGVEDMIAKAGMKFSAAQLAGANAVASMAAAPFPLNMSAPAFGATAMGSAMAFEFGGMVPGVELGDVVPAMLTPGEAVLPKNIVDHFKNSGNNDNNSGVTHVHHHRNEFHMHAIDGVSVERMLDKHSDKFEKHVESHFRKRNM